MKKTPGLAHLKKSEPRDYNLHSETVFNIILESKRYGTAIMKSHPSRRTSLQQNYKIQHPKNTQP